MTRAALMYRLVLGCKVTSPHGRAMSPGNCIPPSHFSCFNQFSHLIHLLLSKITPSCGIPVILMGWGVYFVNFRHQYRAEDSLWCWSRQCQVLQCWAPPCVDQVKEFAVNTLYWHKRFWNYLVMMELLLGFLMENQMYMKHHKVQSAFGVWY